MSGAMKSRVRRTHGSRRDAFNACLRHAARGLRLPCACDGQPAALSIRGGSRRTRPVSRRLRICWRISACFRSNAWCWCRRVRSARTTAA